MCLALISHELRTPTNAIIGWTRLIKDGCSDESILAHGIDVIERNARVQAELIEQLLDFSRVNNGLLRLDAQFNNSDHVAISIHNYRWRLGLAGGEGKYDEFEKRLATAPVITVPTITLFRSS